MPVGIGKKWKKPGPYDDRFYGHELTAEAMDVPLGVFNVHSVPDIAEKQCASPSHSVVLRGEMLKK